MMADDLRPDVMIDGIIPLLDVGPYLAGESGALQKLGRELRYAFERVLLHPCAGCPVGYKQWHDEIATSRTCTAGSGFQRPAVHR
jgi:hypothetical protein